MSSNTLKAKPTRLQTTLSYGAAHLGRIIAAILLAVIVSIVMLYMSLFLREKRIMQAEDRAAKQLGSIGGEVSYLCFAPTWVPSFIHANADTFYYAWIANLSGCNVSTEILQELAAMRQLRSVHLNESPITDAQLVSLQSLMKLEAVLLNKTAISDTGLEHLKGLTNLTHLHLNETQVSDAGLEHLRAMDLLELKLAGTRITDAGLEHLKHLNRLETLCLDETETTVEGRSVLRKALPYCTITPDP